MRSPVKELRKARQAPPQSSLLAIIAKFLLSSIRSAKVERGEVFVEELVPQFSTCNTLRIGKEISVTGGDLSSLFFRALCLPNRRHMVLYVTFLDGAWGTDCAASWTRVQLVVLIEHKHQPNTDVVFGYVSPALHQKRSCYWHDGSTSSPINNSCRKAFVC